MRLTTDYWIKYITIHTSANKTAERLMERYIAANGTEDMDKLSDYAYAIVSKYGEAASALSCEMYDQMARAQNVNVPEALPAETASYGEVAKAVRGAGKRSPSLIPNAVGRLVKQAGADTTLQNAKRDGAYFAWVSHGDTCPYCLALAALGWRKAGKMTLEGGHAEHIHANCDCEYAIDLKGNLEIDGYDPKAINQQILDMTDGEFDAEDLIRRSGHNAKGHDHGALNIVRRKQYAFNKEYINAQKRAAYARRQVEYNGLPKKWRIVEEPSTNFALKGANPNYNRNLPDDMIDPLADYNNNCTNTVVAYEMRCRNYDVTACSTKECSALKHKLFTAWEGRNPTTATGKGYEEIVDFLSDKESGTRVAVTIEFKQYAYSTKKRHGHAFVMEKRGDEVLIVNPQSGSIITSKIFDEAQIGKTRYMRIDDLKLSDRGVTACKMAE